MHYLQDEYRALLVKVKFDDTTAQFSRSLQKGNPGLDQQSTSNVRVAAELSGIAAVTKRHIDWLHSPVTKYFSHIMFDNPLR